MSELLENFGKKVFDDAKMKEKLPSPVYDKWKATIAGDGSLDRETADAIAHAMKEWALENGCTHFTHWFQPLTGVTAEKHDCFLDKKDGKPITKFSGKNLIKGEPDASSFPSGGLRATFEARGYTYWDCTSPAFIRDNILCVPTVFVSYTGEALDTKAPLLKSMDFVSKAATRLLNIFGDKKVTSVTPVVGLEQEYFLVDIEDFKKREDLLLTGRSLLGALPPKGQELETHYFGSIPNRVHEFMKDVNEQLWELGIYAKAEHNEVAPGQFEIVPIFSNCNTAIDRNLIMMDVLQKTALKHGLVCLLAEKPFAGINGSGKHNNYSLIANTGTNVFDPGKNPHENIQFMTFIAAFVKAVDEHAELIRLFSSCPGNDYRLGANEAPPAIVSVYLGDAIEGLFNSISKNKPTDYKKKDLKEFGLSTLSYLPHDNSDRNRTSPVAFTGSKFEVRMLGSSMSPGYLNTALNTILGESLNEISDAIEHHKYRQDIRKAALEISSEIMEKHSRVVFNGNGYSKEWIIEAAKRGLLNIPTFVEAVDYVESHDSGKIFIENNIFTDVELKARYEIFYESYYKLKNIEEKTLISMLRSEVYPSLIQMMGKMAKASDYLPNYSKKLLKDMSGFIDASDEISTHLEIEIEKAKNFSSFKEKGLYLLKQTIVDFEKLRKLYDDLEPRLDKHALPYPTYDSFFFGLDF